MGLENIYRKLFEDQFKTPEDVETDTKTSIISFLLDNPNASKHEVESFANQSSIEVENIYGEIFSLASRMAAFLSGGLAKEQGITEKDVSKEELELGIETESEHTEDEEIAKKIALDHLSEIGNYYSLLKDMEEED